MGRSGGVSLIAAMIVCASSRSMWRDTLNPKRLRFSCRWIIVMTREPCDFSIARIAWTRFRENHRPMSNGCRAIAAIKIQIKVEKSKDIANLRELDKTRATVVSFARTLEALFEPSTRRLASPPRLRR